MKLKPVFLLAASLLIITANGARATSLARHHHPQIAHQQIASQHRFAQHRFASHRFAERSGYRTAVQESAYGSFAAQEVGSYAPAPRRSVGGRPAAWCGWEMRQLVGSDPGPQYNLARNWAHWGHAASGPAPGVVGVMAHHVFKVISVVGPGQVLAISGNDGHAVRTRVRSISGVIAWRGT
jgi:hypothetical protein